jgi:hypothetical protein|tara:strand:- start:1797 stop:2522 length:726 start_codon:yes stop_codon:yes gene_type:complete
VLTQINIYNKFISALRERNNSKQTKEREKLNKIQAKEILGSYLSCTSKMPCYSYNLSALDCIKGSKLVNVKGSVCYGCYALNGNYKRYNLPLKLQHKTKNISNNDWCKALAYLINNQGNKKDKNFFRWHDSGDLQSVEHLKKIIEVCKMTPNVKHWLPTREYGIVNKYIKQGDKIPKNLVIRFSAHMIDTKPPKTFFNTSTVHKDKSFIGVECVSYKNKNECGSCRMCWDGSIKNISYKYH